jgi:hypothetical protein
MVYARLDRDDIEITADFEGYNYLKNSSRTSLKKSIICTFRMVFTLCGLLNINQAITTIFKIEVETIIN